MGVLVPEEEATLQQPQSSQEQPQPKLLPSRALLDSFCCGCSIRIGCFIIGCFDLVIGISLLYGGGEVLIFFVMYPVKHIIANVIIGFYGVWHLVTGLSLIYGVEKRKTSLLKFWIYTRYVDIVLMICSALRYAIQIISYLHYIGLSLVLFVMIFLGFGIGIVAYSILTVESFYREISDVQRLNECV